MPARLTPRQIECLRLSANMTDKEAALVLGISHHTVSNHIRAAMETLGVTSRREARLALGMTVDPSGIPSVMASAATNSLDPTADSDLSRPVAGQSWYRPPPSKVAARLVLILIAAIGATVLAFGTVSIMSNGMVTAQNLAPHNAR